MASDLAKKRKKSRNMNDEDLKSSRQMTLELQSSVIEDLDPVLLVSFPASSVPENLELTHDKINDSSWKTELSGETQEMIFSGTNYGRTHHNQNSAQWLVGIADMDTDIISIHPVSHAFTLRSRLKNVSNNPEVESTEASARERRAQLFEDFGASKKKRALAASAANLVSSEQAIGAGSISSWMAASPRENNAENNMDETDVALVEARRVLLPSFNLDAKTAAECFNVKSIVGEAERSTLAREFDTLKSNGGAGWISSEPVSEWPGYVTRRLENVVAANRDDVVDLLLLRHLMAIHLRHSKLFRGPLKDDATALGIPAEVLKCLLDKFALSSDSKGDGNLTWRMTQNLQHKLVLHLLVLALKVSAFQIQTSELSGDLKMTSSECANLLRYAGTRISVDKANGGHSAVLSVPLTFPGRRRKRG